jgi:hypothetical protein
VSRKQSNSNGWSAGRSPIGPYRRIVNFRARPRLDSNLDQDRQSESGVRRDSPMPDLDSRATKKSTALTLPDKLSRLSYSETLKLLGSAFAFLRFNLVPQRPGRDVEAELRRSCGNGRTRAAPPYLRVTGHGGTGQLDSRACAPGCADSARVVCPRDFIRLQRPENRRRKEVSDDGGKCRPDDQDNDSAFFPGVL